MTCRPVKMSRDEFDAFWSKVEAEKAQRAADMPTEQDAIEAMHQAYLRLKELGWNDAIYCPKDGTGFDAIEVGSTGIQRCHYSGEWPDGDWWAVEAGDLWPSRPSLYRVSEEEKASWAKAGEALRAMIAPSTTPES